MRVLTTSDTLMPAMTPERCEKSPAPVQSMQDDLRDIKAIQSSPVQPRPGWQTLGPEDVLQVDDVGEREGETLIVGIGGGFIGMRAGNFPYYKFRRREGGERKSFKELAEIARKSPHYELEGAILALTEDHNEKPLLELLEGYLLRAKAAENLAESQNANMLTSGQEIDSLRARLAEVERENIELRKRII